MSTLKILIWLIVINLLGTVNPILAADTIRLSAPASMADALKALIIQYGATGKQVQVIPNFGPSGALAKQINEGAPADLFISANQKWMRFLIDEKRIEPTTEKILAGNSLVFAGRKNQTITTMADIVKLKQIAIGSPTSVPAGEYALQALTGAGVYARLEAGKQLVMAKDVRQALTYADRGEVDGAFVYKTDGLLAGQAVILFEVPQTLYAPVIYLVALTVEGARKAESRAFYEFLTGPESMQVFVKYGFRAIR